jgi:hypothetical protein
LIAVRIGNKEKAQEEFLVPVLNFISVQAAHLNHGVSISVASELPSQILKLFTFDVFSQLRYFETERNALFPFHAFVGIHHFKKMVQGMRILFQMDNPSVFRLIVIYINIYPALAYFRIERRNFLAQFHLVVHNQYLLFK